MGLWGAGCPGGQKLIFLNMIMWHIKSTGMTIRTECKLNFHPRVKQVVKRSNIINMSISKTIIPNFVCVLTKKDRKHIEQNFHSVARVMPRGGTCGVLGDQKLKRGDLRWRPIDCVP